VLSGARDLVKLSIKKFILIIKPSDHGIKLDIQQFLLVIAAPDERVKSTMQHVRNVGQDANDLIQLVIDNPLLIVAAGGDLGQILRRTDLKSHHLSQFSWNPHSFPRYVWR
jgi:hypothetical protein